MISTPISVGELIDKLSILKIKTLRIKNEDKLFYIHKEYNILYKLAEIYLQNKNVEQLYEELLNINSELWDIEDRIRELEKIKSFDKEFVETARKVYMTNDKRFEIKNKINLITESEIQEVKGYAKY
jgi:predicted nuclease with TOPRIM domain